LIPMLTRDFIRSVYAPVLPAGASETHHQTLKSTANVILHGKVNDIKYTIQKLIHLRLLFNVIHYAFITTVHGFKFLDAARIKYAAAIKNESTTVAAFILRNALLI